MAKIFDILVCFFPNMLMLKNLLFLNLFINDAFISKENSTRGGVIERVEKELEDFLKKDFFHRSGGGIGMTRMIRAMKLSNLI